MAALEIVGAAEAAEILDIGNTNFSHLRKQRADTDDAFPEPMVTLKCGPIWKKSDVDKYAKTFTKGRRGPKPADATAPSKAIAKKSVVKKVVAKKKLALAKS
jgi:hypothetical protein